jgi:hypothetical protein
LTAVRALVMRSLPTGASVRVHRDSSNSWVEIAVPVEGPVAVDIPPLIVRGRATAITEPGAATAEGDAAGAPES